jgi:hypothetical protein
LNIEKIKEAIAMKYMAKKLLENDIEILPKNNELRTFVCSLRPSYAYVYAVYVDKEPFEETRIAACKEPIYAYLYACGVDEKPLEETRAAAYKKLDWKKEYQIFERKYYEQHRKD